MASLRKKITKALFVVVIVLITMVLGVFALLYFEAQDYLNKNLSELILRKSKGNYEMTFDHIEVSFRHRGFEIKQVKFHPSDSIMRSLDQATLEKQFYSFSSPSIRLENIGFIKLLLHKELTIGEIIISKPELNIHGKTNDTEDKKTNISSILQELKPLVTKVFKNISIGKIELSNASFDFYNLLGDTKKLANAENITIGILQFYTDSVLLPDQNRLFDAEDIYLRMSNYQNKLADSIHTLSAESVTYSLKHSGIEAQNIELKPSNSLVTSKGRYHILVPQARIISKNITELYQKKIIPIDTLQLTDAKISYWPGMEDSKLKLGAISEFNLYELIQDEFSSVAINYVDLENTQLKLFKSPTDSIGKQELKNISIKLDHFLLDSVSVRDTSRIFYSQNIDFSASEYELTLDDNIHRVSAGSLDLSTWKKSVFVKNIQIYPIRNGSASIRDNNTIEASCDSVYFDMFNFKKAFHEKRFSFQSIILFNPEFKLTQNENATLRSVPDNPSFIYNLISSYIKGVYSKRVWVQKGRVQLINKTGILQTGNIESDIRLQLTGFALDEVSARRTDRLFFANQIELTFSNYQMHLVDQLHKLTIDNVTLSSRKRKAQVSNLHLFPTSKENMSDLLKKYNRSELYEFTIPELILSNVDFHEAFYAKKLSVDTLNIQSPQIYYENFALLKQQKPKAEFEDLFKLLSDYLDDVHFGKVNIPDGTIRLINHDRKGKTISLDNHFSLGLENMIVNQQQFGRKRLLFSDYIDFSLRNHVFRLPDNVHLLKAGEVGFSSRKREIYVENAELYPETTSKDYSSILWNIQLKIPEVRIKGINMEELFFDRKIDADNFQITSPAIKLYQQRKKSDAKDLKDIPILLPKEIESIAIRQFQITDGSLKVFSEISALPYLLVQSDIKMGAQDILIYNHPDEAKTEFKRGEYNSELLQLKYTPKDKNLQFSIDRLFFSTKDRMIQVRQLSIAPKKPDHKQNQFELRVPSLAMNGFNVDDAYSNNKFLFESIVIDKPAFSLYSNEKDSTGFNPYNLNLYPHIESFADVFASDLVSVNDADVSVLKNGQKKLQEKGSFSLRNFRIDAKRSNKFMNADDFSFSIPNLKRQGKLYQFTIGKTFYSSLTNRMVAQDIHLIPRYNRDTHQKQLGFQSDYFSGAIDSVSLSQPNIRQWFENGELFGKSLVVSGLNLDVYRDKRVPFNEAQRPKMFHDLLRSSKILFSIDSLNLVNSTITYSERVPGGNSDGKIRFSNVKARIQPLSNKKNINGKIPDLIVDGMANVLDSSLLKVHLNYQLSNSDNLFSVTGSLSPFNMHILNPVIEPLASISVRSGRVNRFEFTFFSDRTKSSGSLLLGYDNFKISVLEKKNGNTKESKFASFIANSLLLRSKNPRGKELLPDEISYFRDPKRADINYWWKSVFSGVKNTLGLKENKTDQPK